MKITHRLLSLAIGLTLVFAVNAQVAAVRFTVEIPCPVIQKDSSVYLVGSFNNWNPKDTNYKMTRVDNRHYTLLVPCFDGKSYEYKYTLGEWSGVEKKADNSEISNRKFISKNKLKITDVVIKWNEKSPVVPKDTVNGLNKAQIARLTVLKDSLTNSLTPMVPRLLDELKNINLNLLDNQSGAALNKQYVTNITEIVGQVLSSLVDGVKGMVDLLTPEQKQKIKEAMNKPDAPKDMMSLISTTLLSDGGKK